MTHLAPSHQQLLAHLAVKQGNAWVLSGPARVGKRQLAMQVAALHNCAHLTPGSVPCGVCPSCRALLAGHHPDVLLLAPPVQTAKGKASRRKVIPVSAVVASRDDGHDYEQHVYEFLEVRPTYRRRVVVVDGAEYLNEQAANALLKLVEQPPHGALFLFLTEDVRAMIPTLVSRSGRLQVPPITDGEWLAQSEQQGHSATSELLHFAAGRAGLLEQLGNIQSALQDARTLTHTAQQGLWPALQAAQALEPTFDPALHPEALRFVWQQELSLAARTEADRALEALQEALEAYANPALSFQVFVLNLRQILGA